MPCTCGGDNETRLLYSCAGAANTGFLADQVTRALGRDGAGAMTCLAAVGADLSGFVESARAASRNIVIDGCPVGCAKRIFEARGLPFEQFVMTEFDVHKGKTAITGEVIERVTAEVKARLGEPAPSR